MTTSTTPPPLQAPSAKEKKYDRQLRLWAASGQLALENAHVLLLNDGPGVVGVETLKNLILPSIGNFTIVDSSKVQEEDLGVNFFLSEDSLGKSRAEESCRFLRELNPDVNGHAVKEPMDSFLARQDVLSQYTMILLASSPKISRDLARICEMAAQSAIPLFYIHSVGFYSQFSVQLPSQFPIVDTHPDPASTQELRLLNPWPELSEYMLTKTSGLESLSDHEHGHVPYLLLLLYYLQEWKSSHGGKPPQTYKEKSNFRALIREGARKDNAEGGEENYDEAAGAVLRSLNPPSISSGLREVFEADECRTPKLDSANFWVIAHAIRKFHALHDQLLPLPGSVPDMKAQSKDYIELQNIYKSKARKDLAETATYVRAIEKQLGRKYAIDEKEIEAFCKGAAFVKLIKGKPILIPYKPDEVDLCEQATYLLQEFDNEESLLPISLSFLAYDHVISEQHPDNPLSLDDFAAALTQYTTFFLDRLNKFDTSVDLKATRERTSSVVSELARAAGTELHNISALTGGMVAQEALKVLMKQYIPIDNTCVFDGITSKTGVFRV